MSVCQMGSETRLGWVEASQYYWVNARVWYLSKEDSH